MKKKTILSFLFASVTLGSLFADNLPLQNGYYRVKNYKTNRYVYVYDNTGKINAAAGTADAGALDLWKDLNRAISDPGSVLYANYIGPNGKGGYSYDVEGQGTGVHDIIGHYVSIYRKSNGHLNLYASLGGFTKYLDDEETNLTLAQGQMGFNRTGDFQLWDEFPIDAASDNYFGVAPTVSANGKYYQPFYAAFPFNYASSGMKSYYIKEYLVTEGIAVIAELTGDVPGAMPLIIECSSSDPSDNRLNLLRNHALPLEGNKLAGVYFNNPYREDSPDAQTRYDVETMRVLGTNAEGQLVFTKYNKTYLPANQSYLVVPAGSPEEIQIMTEEDYNARIINVSSVVLSDSELNLVEGDSYQLTVEVGPDNATDSSVTWSSSDANVITVDQTGLVTAVAPGTAVVTVKANDGSEIEASCTITVEKNIILVSSLLLSETSVTVMEGDSYQLTAEVGPDNATDSSVTWSSSDANVITVDQTGLVTAVAPGTAVVIVKANDGSAIEASCTITVEKKIILVSSLLLSETAVTVKEGETFQLTAAVLPEDATDASLTWASSDESLATVDNTGLVQALVHGEVVISVVANDASGLKAECIVTIEQEAGITAVSMDAARLSDIYNLSGVKVRNAGESLHGLAAGLYVVDGKKVIIY